MALARGFADPVHDAQGAFRTLMDALARPGRIGRLASDLSPPAPLTPELAAVALALTDADTPVWLDAPLAANPAVAAFLRFHTGAPIVAEPADAAFALIADPAACPPFAAFAQGSPDYPDTSATLVLALDRLSEDGAAFEGPGIRGRIRLAAAPLPADWPARLAANHAAFPRGLDLVLTAPGVVAGLPRSSRPVPSAAPSPVPSEA